MFSKWIIRLVAAIVVLGLVGWIAVRVSPWPSVLLIRHTFDADSAKRNSALEKLVPSGLVAKRDEVASSGKYDVFEPGSPGPRPVVFWIHGGAFIAGQKEDIAPYLQILAAKGYTTVGIGYKTAPSVKYPEPVRQVNETIAHVLSKASDYGIDPDRVFLAGDSAGSQIAAQTAAVVTDPLYANETGIKPGLSPTQLRGIILNCGIFDPSKINLDGAFGGFIRTVLWSYFGEDDPAKIEKFDEFNVTRNVGGAFPPAFITVGNADPLAPQSILMAEALKSKGIAVDELYFEKDHQPPLGHEYQFNLETADAKLAFDRMNAFLEARSN